MRLFDAKSRKKGDTLKSAVYLSAFDVENARKPFGCLAPFSLNAGQILARHNNSDLRDTL